MKIFLFISLFALTLSAAAQESANVKSDRMQCFLVAPVGWVIDTSRSDEIIVSESPRSPIFISLKRYELEDDNRIGSEQDLSQAIVGLYRKMGVPLRDDSLPSFEILAGKAHFQADYSTFSVDGKTRLRRLVDGTIVRLADGEQTLFLFVAEAPADLYYMVFPNFLLTVRSFQVTASTNPKVFASAGAFKYFLILLLIGLTIFFFARNRRVQRSFNPLGADSNNFWRCASCGRVNHNDIHYCHRCGAQRVIINAPNK